MVRPAESLGLFIGKVTYAVPGISISVIGDIQSHGARNAQSVHPRLQFHLGKRAVQVGRVLAGYPVVNDGALKHLLLPQIGAIPHTYTKRAILVQWLHIAQVITPHYLAWLLAFQHQPFPTLLATTDIAKSRNGRFAVPVGWTIKCIHPTGCPMKENYFIPFL